MGLQKRHSLNKTDWTSLLIHLTTIAKGNNPTYQTTLMESEYNSSDPLVTLDEIVQFQAEWPNAEPIARTESLLCLGTHGSHEVADSLDAASQLCQLACPAAGFDKRSNATILLSAAKTVFATNIAESEELYSSSEGFGQPSWGYITQGIMGGELTLEYEMLVRTRGGEEVLEIVWRLPDGPEYRETNSDEYAVFHFHFDHIMDRGGVFRAGIYAVVAFHGQEYVEQKEDPCPTRWYFRWGRRQSRPFTPDYILGEAAEDDIMDDNNDV